MSTINDGQISLYCKFDKIIIGVGTSFQSPAMNQKHVRNAFHTEISISVTSIMYQCPW